MMTMANQDWGSRAIIPWSTSVQEVTNFVSTMVVDNGKNATYSDLPRNLLIWFISRNLLIWFI